MAHPLAAPSPQHQGRVLQKCCCACTEAGLQRACLPPSPPAVLCRGVPADGWGPVFFPASSLYLCWCLQVSGSSGQADSSPGVAGQGLQALCSCIWPPRPPRTTPCSEAAFTPSLFYLLNLI